MAALSFGAPIHHHHGPLESEGPNEPDNSDLITIALLGQAFGL